MTFEMVDAGGVWSVLAGDGPCRRSYEVAFSEAAGQVTVYVNGTPVPVALPAGAPARRGRRSGAAVADTSDGPLVVAAPMPGRVVKVLVAVGDAVAARQGLIVVEAMKMENELRAPRAGTVRDIRVTQGTPVEANAVLVVLE